MIRFLVSDLMNYDRNNKTTHPISNSNGIVDQIKANLKNTNKIVFVASDIASTEETIGDYANTTFNSFKLVGITFKEYYILDGTKCSKAKEYIKNADLIFLCGGETYKQHKLFNKINLKELLKDYDGMVIGQSAGALNMSKNVFNSPEDGEESEPIFFDGLGLTDINIEPHFVYDSKDFNEIETYKRNIIIEESYNRTLYGQCNGSHIFIGNDNKAIICGETYLIKNGKIKKICDNKEQYRI